MKMKTHVYDIKEITNIVAPIAQEFGIRKLAIFGSYARGEANESSDIDFHIIDRGTLRGLFRLAGFESALEDSLNRPVDVVTSGSLYDDILQNIESEEMIIYEG
jgi:predicted nucleotidyltransferase